MRPYVLINFACSLDGRITDSKGRQYKFSNQEDLERVHRIRAESDVILVGKNTVNNDDPKLTVNRKYFDSSKLPDVAILDSNLTVNRKATLFTFPRTVVMLCGNSADSTTFREECAARISIRKSNERSPSPNFAIDALEDLGYERVMIEGGRSVITSFISADVWDEISIFYSPCLIGSAGIPMVDVLNDPMTFRNPSMKILGSGFLLSIKKEF